MMKSSLILAAVLALALGADSGLAAPIAQFGTSISVAADTMSLVEPVNRCHRGCRLGPVPRWGGIVVWHRHVGRDCWPRYCAAAW
jgi:hypothetical protein